jgi:hypothetical protein
MNVLVYHIGYNLILFNMEAGHQVFKSSLLFMHVHEFIAHLDQLGRHVWFQLYRHLLTTDSYLILLYIVSLKLLETGVVGASMSSGI